MVPSLCDHLIWYIFLSSLHILQITILCWSSVLTAILLLLYKHFSSDIWALLMLYFCLLWPWVSYIQSDRRQPWKPQSLTILSFSSGRNWPDWGFQVVDSWRSSTVDDLRQTFSSRPWLGAIILVFTASYLISFNLWKTLFFYRTTNFKRTDSIWSISSRS